MDKTKFNEKSGLIISSTGIIDGSLQNYEYFLPKDIPRDLVLTNTIIKKLAQANLNVGELKGLAKNISKTLLNLFIKAYKRREAWLSTKIEGTNVSLTDIFLSEAGNLEKKRFEDIKEVTNYIHALDTALTRINVGKEINKDLINEMHYTLLERVRGHQKLRGEYRKVQNWIDGKHWNVARFIPPHYDKVESLMENMFSFMREEDDIPRLIKIGLMHYYFETIHPYEDGNGRLGRTLIVLYLKKINIFEEPLLYPSPFFEKNTRQYYDLLMKVREEGDYLGWLDFFLEGICKTAQDTSRKIEKLIELHGIYHKKLEKIYAKTISFTVLDLFFENPYRSIPFMQVALKKNYPLIKRGIKNLIDVGFVKEYTYRKRNKFYVAKEIIDVLESD